MPPGLGVEVGSARRELHARRVAARGRGLRRRRRNRSGRRRRAWRAPRRDGRRHARGRGNLASSLRASQGARASVTGATSCSVGATTRRRDGAPTHTSRSRTHALRERVQRGPRGRRGWCCRGERGWRRRDRLRTDTSAVDDNGGREEHDECSRHEQPRRGATPCSDGQRRRCPGHCLQLGGVLRTRPPCAQCGPVELVAGCRSGIGASSQLGEEVVLERSARPHAP